MSEKLIDRLIERLNDGEVIPDEDLEGIRLKDDEGDWSPKISDLLVASAGKPGQGILRRIDPKIFKDSTRIALHLHYDLFPIKGKFDFEHAVGSLMILMRSLQSSDMAEQLNAEIFLIFLGFWLYHGDNKYSGEFYNACKNELRVLDVKQDIRYRSPMFWGATQKRWDLFVKFKFPSVEIKSVPPTDLVDSSHTNVKFAPLYIIKAAIKQLPGPKIEGYNAILLTFKSSQVTHMYPDGKGEARPKGSIKDLFDATNALVDWTADDADSLRRISATFTILRNALVRENDFNPRTLKWLSETYFVESLSPNSVNLGVSRGSWFISKGFLMAITPGITEKVSGTGYQDVLETQQKETMNKIVGTVRALHGVYPNDVISRVVMASLPWERVWIGVGGKREHGKMGDAMYRYIGGVIDSIERIKAEKSDEALKAGSTKRVRTRASSGDDMSEDEMIEKLKKVFTLEIKED